MRSFRFLNVVWKQQDCEGDERCVKGEREKAK